MNKTCRRASSFLALLILPVLSTGAAPLKTKNVLLVTIDGLRWQEVFRGADEACMDRASGGVREDAQAALRTSFLADTPEKRREILMPFFWQEIATHGQLIGNRDAGSPMEVKNPAWISYPGYNELLTGYPDPELTANEPRPNPNVSVLEWLDQQPGFSGKIVGCATWSRFSSILNVERSTFPLWISGRHSRLPRVSPALADIQRWMDDIPLKEPNEHYDAFAQRAALSLIDDFQPRVLYVAWGETDSWAHARRYDNYLAAAQRCDRFIRDLWEKLQSLPQYRGTTTLIVTTDHGRGATGETWTSHGRAIPHSNETWMVVMGPDTPPLGERHNLPLVASGQVAATLAKLLGEKFNMSGPDKLPPIDAVIQSEER